MFNVRHHRHSQAPIKKINQFCAKNKIPNNAGSTKIIEKPKKIKQNIDETEHLDAIKKLRETVLDSFEKKIKSTTDDIYNEIYKLKDKEITCDMAKSLKSSWCLIKQAKRKLIEANALSTEIETSESIESYESQSTSFDSTEFDEYKKTVKRKCGEAVEGLHVKRIKRFDSISIVDGSINLRRYDDKYKLKGDRIQSDEDLLDFY